MLVTHYVSGDGNLSLRFKVNEGEDLLTESEASGFLDVPLELPLDSTERQKHIHAITIVTDNNIILSVAEAILKRPKPSLEHHHVNYFLSVTVTVFL